MHTVEQLRPAPRKAQVWGPRSWGTAGTPLGRQHNCGRHVVMVGLGTPVVVLWWCCGGGCGGVVLLGVVGGARD